MQVMWHVLSLPGRKLLVFWKKRRMASGGEVLRLSRQMANRCFRTVHVRIWRITIGLEHTTSISRHPQRLTGYCTSWFPRPFPENPTANGTSRIMGSLVDKPHSRTQEEPQYTIILCTTICVVARASDLARSKHARYALSDYKCLVGA